MYGICTRVHVFSTVLRGGAYKTLRSLEESSFIGRRADVPWYTLHTLALWTFVRFKETTFYVFWEMVEVTESQKEFWTGVPSLKYQIRILKVVDKFSVWWWSHHTAHYIEFKTMSPSINAVSKRKTQRNSHLNLPCCWSCFVFGSHFVSTPPPTPQVLPLTWSSKLFFGTKLTDQMFSKAVMTGQNRKLQMLMNGGRPHYISSRYCGSKNHFFSERMFSFFCGILGKERTIKRECAP